jgi:hypothetical protein
MTHLRPEKVVTIMRGKGMKKTKLWGIWIPSLNLWLEDDGRVDYVTDIKREAVAVVQKECVHPKQYEVREYGVSDATGNVDSTSTGPR